MSIRKMKAGEILFKEDDLSNSCYLIQNGVIRIYKQKQEAMIEIETLRAGSLVGELAFLDNQPRSATAEAITECELVEISRTLLNDTMAKTPEWLKILLKSVTGRVRSASNKIRILESASSEYETDKWGNRSREFVYISRSELMRFMASVSVVVSRYGTEETIDGVVFPVNLLERYSSQILQVADSKTTSLIELMKTVNLFKPGGSDPSKPSLMLTDIKFIDQFQWFMNEQNLLEANKQRFISNRGFLLLSLINQYLDGALNGAEGKATLNVAPILAAEGQTMCNPPLRADEMQELQDQRFVESLTFASANQLDVVFKPEKLMLEFRIFWVINEVEKLNEKQRKVK
jgi:CRP-like cAMP-binding protein